METHKNDYREQKKNEWNKNKKSATKQRMANGQLVLGRSHMLYNIRIKYKPSRQSKSSNFSTAKTKTKRNMKLCFKSQRIDHWTIINKKCIISSIQRCYCAKFNLCWYLHLRFHRSSIQHGLEPIVMDHSSERSVLVKI